MQEKINLTRQVPILGSCDLLVVGGGPAGIAAALAAARMGLSVTVAERSGQLGGLMTLGSVAIYMPVGTLTGIYKEIITETLPKFLESGGPDSYYSQYNPFYMRYYYNKKLSEAGVKVNFHTEFVSVLKEGDVVTGAVFHTREGLAAIKAKITLDSSGDGVVAIDAGAQYTSGREEDGLTQPMTLMFLMQDTGKPVHRLLPEGCDCYESIEELPQGRILKFDRNDDGTLLVNMTRVKGNGARVEDTNHAEMEALRQVFSVADYLQRHGYENYILSHIASQTGARETNQIVCDYTLTEQDIRSASRFDDVVAQTNYEIDIHSPTGDKECNEQKVDLYDIPYRCMLPRGLENMLVAGRAISADHVAMSSMRTQATCLSLGQAAGAAAALAVQQHCSLRNISIPKLHEELAKQGVEFIR